MFKIFILLSLSFFLSRYACGAESAKLFNDKGTVSLQRGEHITKIAAGKSEKATEGDIIKTGDNSAGHLEFSDGSRIDLQANSTLQIKTMVKDDKGSKSIFNLLIGTVSVFVNKLLGKEDVFEVETPTAVGSVRGTTFQMSVYLDEEFPGMKDMKKSQKFISVLSVLEGEVATCSPEKREKILDLVKKGNSVFITPDRELHRMDKFLDLLKTSPSELKHIIREKIKKIMDRRSQRNR